MPELVEMMYLRKILSLLLLACLFRSAASLDNGLARTPILGYNTWNCFGGDSEPSNCDTAHPASWVQASGSLDPDFPSLWSAVSEELVKRAADLLISTGLQKAGYQYLVVDGMSLLNFRWRGFPTLGCCSALYTTSSVDPTCSVQAV